MEKVRDIPGIRTGFYPGSTVGSMGNRGEITRPAETIEQKVANQMFCQIMVGRVLVCPEPARIISQCPRQILYFCVYDVTASGLCSCIKIPTPTGCRGIP